MSNDENSEAINKNFEKIRKQIVKLPGGPGVYFFLGAPKFGQGGRQILYIGKATSLRNRVRSYFTDNLEEKRGPLVAKIPGEVKKIDFIRTDSVLEALILEANLIKKHLPPYNTAQKDQKSWNYVVITKEEFPRVLMMRERELDSVVSSQKLVARFGPFPHGGELREAMKIIRKIFPYRDRCTPAYHPRPSGTPSYLKRGNTNEKPRPCFERQIGLCPGVCTGEISKEEYAKIIKSIKMFLGGKMKILAKNLEKEMKAAAKNKEFEKASQIKSRIFSLKHINDVALLKSDTHRLKSRFRIEAYDISHISGTSMVGAMVVIEDGEAKKGDYRLFNVKNQNKSDDIKALREVLERRFKHNEWPYPNLIVVDGNKVQMSAARAEIWNFGLKIPVSGVVKDEKHRPRELLGAKRETLKYKREILLANSEAHRFAIKATRKKFSKIA